LKIARQRKQISNGKTSREAEIKKRGKKVSKVEVKKLSMCGSI
jgi:hypothetical protein